MRARQAILIAGFLSVAPVSNAQECANSFWEYLGDYSIYAVENGTLQPGVVVTYGYTQEAGVTIRPSCTIESPPNQPVKIPVLLIDFHDYQPGVDLSNPNNPASGELPDYVMQTAQQVSTYLNGPDGPAQYFDDISGGQFKLEFDVHGWIESSDTGYLRGRDNYMFMNGDNWFCRREDLMRDAIRESIVNNGVDWTQYDVEVNDHSNTLKNIDGAVLVYEGGPGLCSGTNMSFLSGESLGKEDTQSGYYAYGAEDFRTLVDGADPNTALFAAQPVLLNRYNNIPETAVSRPSTGAWVHELGHLLLGFPDYYANKYNVRGWALSGANGVHAIHPSAYEKWLFGGWIQPVSLPAYGTVEVLANQHPDGGFDPNGAYLHKFDFDAEANQYISFEYHWFADDGNNAARWASNEWASGSLKQSGILINAFDWRLTIFDTEPQIRRFVRSQDDPDNYLTQNIAFQAGESLDHCYSPDRCVHVAVLDITAGTASVFFSDHEQGFDDYDRDGIINSIDVSPYVSADTDGDGIDNDIDTDDDNDGVADVLDNYPLGRFDDALPGHWAFSFIEAMERAGITSGCGGDNYCPTATVTRAQMAVFLERGMRGGGFSPPAPSGNVFADVGSGDFAAAFIEQLYADGITSGCGNGNFCPDASVTRDQMAVFLLRAKYGSGYSPPAATGSFDDVQPGFWAASWIEQLAQEGITAGCGGNNYCPDADVTRDQMAVFLVRTFAVN